MTDQRALLREVLDAALRAADAKTSVARSVLLDGDVLDVRGHRAPLRERRVRVVGAGKAAADMARGLETALRALPVAGVVITKDGHAVGRGPGPIEVLEAAHPIPDARCVDASRRVARLAAQLDDRDILFCLLSGGASSLMTMPPAGVPLADVEAVTRALLLSGAPIGELNAVRKHLCELKGGRLAALAAPAEVISLMISDVVGDGIDTIASGPTAPDPTTYRDALDVLARRLSRGDVPPAVLRHLEAGAKGLISETRKREDPLFDRVGNHVIASNTMSANAAQDHARRLGLRAAVITTRLEGEAREAGAAVAATIRAVHRGEQPPGRPACLVWAGETTVTVRGGGLGGRNQELALAAAMGIAGIPGVCLAAFATDGQDGPTPAAGAFAAGDTIDRALSRGMNPAAFLEGNDSNTFFAALGDLIVTGPTGTNVADLVVAVLI